MKSYLYLIIAILFLASCKKSSNGVITISGYSATDENGNYIQGASYDSTDWRNDDVLPTQVQSLFDSMQTRIGSNPIIPNQIIEVPGCNKEGAYPNPCSVGFVFYDNNNCLLTCGSKMIMVDQNLHIYKQVSFSGGGSIMINTSNISQGLYRVYYINYDSTGTVISRGHGDILKN